MIEIDAAELARLRAEGDIFVVGFEKMHEICGYAEYRLNAHHVTALIAERRALIDALEKARGEVVRFDNLCAEMRTAYEALRAERDSARALLRKSRPWVECGTEFESTDAEARMLMTELDAELEEHVARAIMGSDTDYEAFPLSNILKARAAIAAVREHAPDPAEAMRAALTQIEAWPRHTRDDLADTVQRMQAIAAAALKGNGEGR